ncbi:MAG: hypothetical protein NC206_02975 [Bacteroides sp.]|nr:hypothetical protein [Roseburia sp.]MCM1346027.1 hypothetical protein [Bacteroides sp.]MCM1420188.1 hypothetical protein [Bacteroides sp.]
MSIRQSKASKINRGLLFGMMFLAVIVFGCVFAMLYVSFEKTDIEARVTSFYEVSISRDFGGDSLLVFINDSMVFTGTVPSGMEKDTVLHAGGSVGEIQMMSVADLSTGESLNENLPKEPSKIFVEKPEGISIRTENK